MTSIMIKIGNFLFKYRNKAFPIIVLGLFALAVPPAKIFGSDDVKVLKDILAVAVILSGLAVRASVIGFAYIKRGGLNKKVYAADLVTDGIFGICRNPLYVGNILICIGLFMGHGNPMVMFTGIALYIFIYQCIVLAEEDYLKNKFGQAYQDYCQDVPRWFLKPYRFEQATEGMTFNLKRVVFKDYGTFATAMAMFTITKIYEHFPLPMTSEHKMHLLTLVLVILALGLMMAFVKSIKVKAAKNMSGSPS